MKPNSVVYSAIASDVANAGIMVLLALSSRVLFPIYRHLADMGKDRLRSRTFRVRLALSALVLPPLYLLILAGPQIIHFAFPDRYGEAGWMLQILASGAAFSVVHVTASPVLLAVGDSFRHMLMLFFQSAVLFLAMFIGGLWGGVVGIIVGAAVAPLAFYPPLVFCIRKYGTWLPGLDAPILLLSLAVSALAYGIHGF